jgi:putative ABC transport system substrate-binding protein
MNTANLEALRLGLRELGYVEGKNLVIVYRSADGRAERFPELVSELIHEKVELIVARGTPATQAANASLTSTPVVTTAVGDPYVLVKNLAKPGGKITGLTSITSELQAKRVEIIKELVPKISRIAVMLNLSNPAQPQEWKEMEAAARLLGLQPQLLDIRKREDIGAAFDTALNQRTNALAIGQETLIQANGKLIVEYAAKLRLPVIYSSKEYVDLGGLISYGVDYPDLYRRAATHIDKILKGTKPGDIPIERPIKFEIVVNMKTAKTLGIKIPNSILVRADKVIE